MMRDTVVIHLKAGFGAYRDLAGSLPEEALDDRLGEHSNTIGAQFWCVVGARESYTRALEKGEWAGFSCSLSGADVVVQSRIVDALEKSETEFSRVVSQSDGNEDRDNFLLGLLEHEIQHQGQLIRFVFGLGHPFPESWVQRWQL